MKRVVSDDTRKYLLKTIIECDLLNPDVHRIDSEIIAELALQDDEELIYEICEMAYRIVNKLNDLINLRRQQ